MTPAQKMILDQFKTPEALALEVVRLMDGENEAKAKAAQMYSDERHKLYNKIAKLETEKKDLEKSLGAEIVNLKKQLEDAQGE